MTGLIDSVGAKPFPWKVLASLTFDYKIKSHLSSTILRELLSSMTTNRMAFCNCLDYPIYSVVAVSRLLGILPLKISTTKTKCFEKDSKTQFQIQANEKITYSVFMMPWCIITKITFVVWFFVQVSDSHLFQQSRSMFNNQCELMFIVLVILYNIGHQFAFLFTDKYAELFNILRSIPYRSRETSKATWKIYVIGVFWAMLPTGYTLAVLYTFCYCLSAGVSPCWYIPFTLPFTSMIVWALLSYKISLELMTNAMTLDDVFDKNVPVSEKVLQQTREMLQKVSRIWWISRLTLAFMI